MRRSSASAWQQDLHRTKLAQRGSSCATGHKVTLAGILRVRRYLQQIGHPLRYCFSGLRR